MIGKLHKTLVLFITAEVILLVPKKSNLQYTSLIAIVVS